MDYDPDLRQLFARESVRIRSVPGSSALRIEHAGSTAVPRLDTKPIIDLVLVVQNSAEEGAYLPALEADGYVLRIREPDWYEHRVFKAQTPISTCMCSRLAVRKSTAVVFRDWPGSNASDRDQYAHTKLALAEQEWKLSGTTPMPRRS